jgi:hypothetical protein
MGWLIEKCGLASAPVFILSREARQLRGPFGRRPYQIGMNLADGGNLLDGKIAGNAAAVPSSSVLTST